MRTAGLFAQCLRIQFIGLPGRDAYDPKSGQFVMPFLGQDQRLQCCDFSPSVDQRREMPWLFWPSLVSAEIRVGRTYVCPNFMPVVWSSIPCSAGLLP